jgi:hypothetical protein
VQGKSGVDYRMGGENEVKVLGAGYVRTVKILVYVLSLEKSLDYYTVPRIASACSAQLIAKNFKCLSTYRPNQKTSYPESHAKATCSKDDLEHEQKENKSRY